MSSIRCTACGALGARVIDSRPARDGRMITRRRRCPTCGARFNTQERTQQPDPRALRLLDQFLRAHGRAAIAASAARIALEEAKEIEND